MWLTQAEIKKHTWTSFILAEKSPVSRSSRIKLDRHTHDSGGLHDTAANDNCGLVKWHTTKPYYMNKEDLAILMLYKGSQCSVSAQVGLSFFIYSFSITDKGTEGH